MPDVLEALRARPEASGLFLDFDGTLAEIVPTPDQARPVEGAVDVLRALAGAFRVVAVISGRRAEGLARRLGRPPGVRCYGLYGLEDERGLADPRASSYQRALDRVLPELEAAASDVQGAWVEAKGFHASVHYRAAPDPAAARSSLLAALGPVAAREGLRIIEGKRVVEVGPEAGPSKGDAVERVAREEALQAILYAGDDLPDLDGFAAVERLRADGVAGLRVAVRSAEPPEELLRSADLIVESPARLVELLGGLVRPR